MSDNTSSPAEGKLEDVVTVEGMISGDSLEEIQKMHAERLEELKKLAGLTWEQHLNVEITREDGTVDKFTTHTGLLPLATKLGEHLTDTDGSDEDKERVTVYVLSVPEAEEEVVKHVIIDDIPSRKALRNILASIISPNDAMSDMAHSSEALCHRSGLKGIIVSAIFDGGAPAGFSYLTSHDDISNEEFVMMVNVAQNHVDMLRDEIKKRNPFIRFGDEKDIII